MRFGARFNADCEKARCSGHPNVGILVFISWVDELLDAGIIEFLMQCSVKLDDLRLKKSS